jgi:hypothetical protein
LQRGDNTYLRFNIDLNLLLGNPSVKVGKQGEGCLAISLKRGRAQLSRRLNLRVRTTFPLGDRSRVI